MNQTGKIAACIVKDRASLEVLRPAGYPQTVLQNHYIPLEQYYMVWYIVPHENCH